MLKQKITAIRQRFLSMLLVSDVSNATLARCIAVGFGSGFLPFPGFQTPFLFPLCWGLRLNFPLMYVSNWLVNNWFTTVPIVLFTIWLGRGLLLAVGLPQPEVVLTLEAFNMGLIKAALLPFLVGAVPLCIGVRGVLACFVHC